MTTDLTPGLHWPIKRSFIRYVARMGDGQILGGHGLHMIDSSTFVFPLAAQVADNPALIAFAGELRLQAHNGALALRIANPRIDLASKRGSVIIDSTEGAGRVVTFATCTVESHAADTWRGTDVRLAVEAVALFGGYYGEGEAFDDFTVVVPT